jgi:ryanodine receptor 2
VFHLYQGVRSGGGIGDVIEPPDGGASEVYRIVFDITFFFFVIVILLAIIQGMLWISECVTKSILQIIS